MPTTTNLVLHYPASSDAPNGPTQLGLLANDFDAFWSAWTPWTPTVTQSGAVTMSTTECSYSTKGKWVKLRGRLIVSGSGTAANKITITAPPSQNCVANGLPVGWAQLGDQSILSWFRGTLEFDSGSATNLVIMLSGGTAGNNTFTAGLAVGDTIDFGGRYPRT